MQVLLLPSARALVSGETALAGAEVAPVHDAAAVPPVHRRDGLVEHLVEHDQLDEVARHARIVERGVDADQLLVVQVHAHLDRPRRPQPMRASRQPSKCCALSCAKMSPRSWTRPRSVSFCWGRWGTARIRSRFVRMYSSIARPCVRRLRPVKPARARTTSSFAAENMWCSR